MVQTENTQKLPLTIVLMKPIHNITLTVLTRFIQMFAGFSVAVLTARFLGPTLRGEYFLYMNFVAIAIQFGDLGFSISTMYQSAKHPDSKQSLVPLFTIIAGVIGILAWVALILASKEVFHLLDIKLNYAFLVGIGIPFGLYALFASNWLIGAGKIHVYNGVESIKQLFLVSSLCFFGLQYASLDLFLCLSIASSILSALILSRWTLKCGFVFKFDRALFGSQFHYAAKSWIISCLFFGMSRFIVLWMDAYTTKEALGIWSIALQIGDAISIIPCAIGQVMFADTVAADDPWKVAKGYIRQTAWIMTLACLGAAVVGFPLIRLAFGKPYEGAYFQLLFLLPGIWLRGILSPLGQYIGAIGQPLYVVPVWGGGLLVSMTLGWFFIRQWQGIGAMISISIAYVFVSACLWILATRNRKQLIGVKV